MRPAAGRPADAEPEGRPAAATSPRTPRQPATKARVRRPVPEEVDEELRAAGGQRLGGTLVVRLADAARAYEHDRYRDALAILRDLSAKAPEAPSVRELHGLTLYRLGRWKDALRELHAAQDLSGSFDQLPVMADCERGLGHHAEVDRMWTELRQAGVSSDLLAEGRLVAAGSLADRGELARAIALLAPAAERAVRRPHDRHVRQWYALADLYERAGELPRARELFARVVETDPEVSDAVERLAALR